MSSQHDQKWFNDDMVYYSWRKICNPSLPLEQTLIQENLQRMKKESGFKVLLEASHLTCLTFY